MRRMPGGDPGRVAARPDNAAAWHFRHNGLLARNLRQGSACRLRTGRTFPGMTASFSSIMTSKCQGVSEFLEFGADGLIKQSVRHLMPRLRHVYATELPDLQYRTQKRAAILQCEARQSLAEARRLPVGSARHATLAATRRGAAGASPTRQCCVGLVGQSCYQWWRWPRPRLQP